MALFLSRSVHKVDKKGRVSVPSGFRTALGDELNQGLALNKPVVDFQCIEALPNSKIEERMTIVDELPINDPEAMELAHQLVGTLSHVTFDPEGRIVLPEYLMEYAGITNTATFVGQGRTFQIWEPDALAAHDASSRPAARKDISSFRKPKPDPQA
jgi:MraZ protein